MHWFHFLSAALEQRQWLHSNAWPEPPPRSNGINGGAEDDTLALFVRLPARALCFNVVSLLVRFKRCLHFLFGDTACLTQTVMVVLNAFLALMRRQICPHWSPVASIKQQYSVFTDWICRVFTVYKEPFHLICIFVATKNTWIIVRGKDCSLG